MSQSKPTPLIILGMHRSGTSCLAGTLEQAGVYLGKVSEYNEYNKKGNRENTRTMQLNEQILSYNEASWDMPPATLKWNKSHEDLGKEIIADFEISCHSQYWGFKDPRVLLTLPFWIKLLPQAKYIGTYRKPLSVAQSLNNRASFSIDINTGLQLWANYNKQLIQFYKINPFPLISFDLAAKEYTEKLKQICALYDLPKLENIDFFDQTLRNQVRNKHNTLTDNIEQLYDELEKISI